MLRNQKGFTLIEIIAVLVILGILAAVAIPKYLSLQDEARNSAAKTAVAGGISALTMTYSKYLLANNGTAPGASTLLATAPLTSNCGVSDLDFTVVCSGAYPILITATGKTGTSVAGGTATGNFQQPN